MRLMEWIREKLTAVRKAGDGAAAGEALRAPDRLPDGYEPTPAGGLSEAEATRRREAGESNRCREEPGKTPAQLVAQQLFTRFNLLNFALALCLALVGSWRNMLFLGVVFSNTLIAVVQELRARREIRRLALLNAPTAHPLREGAEKTCAPEDLVRGDLVILRAGDQVPADAVVVSGGGAADESLLTGESEPVRHAEGDWLLSGSSVTEGRFVAQLVFVGDESYAARLTREARRIRRPASVLMSELDRLIKLLSRLLIPLGLLLFLKEVFLRHSPLTAAVPTAVASMIGMIPEGLMLLTSVAMTAGVMRLAKHGALVQELYGIENLARVDLLCADKTGTLTTGEMAHDSLCPLDAGEEELRQALSRFLAAFEAGSGTLRALSEAAEPVPDTSCGVLPFSSARKLSAAAFPDGTVLILGAPGFVYPQGLPAEAGRIQAEAAGSGLRVLLLAEAHGPIGEDEAPAPERCLGLFLLRDRLRDTAADTLRWFREEGVAVKVISGDDPRTVASVARQAGLDGADRWVDCAALTDEELLARAEETVVFGRVTPARKRLLVEAFKGNAHSVAMTGDGVNDIPALKSADCAIAMGSGADATRHIAQLTLLESDFSVLPRVVAEGRRVINNITRTASLYLVKTIYSFLLTALMLLLPLSYPFQPIQLTLISALTVGVPSFFLALAPNADRVIGSFRQRVLRGALPGGLGVVLCAAGAMAFEHFGVPREHCCTMAALGTGIIGLTVLGLHCRPFASWRAALLAAMALAFAAVVAFRPDIFLLRVHELRQADWLALTGLTALGCAAVFCARAVLKRRRTEPK